MDPVPVLSYEAAYLTRAARFPYASLLAFLVSLWPWAAAKNLVPLPPVAEARIVGWGLAGTIALLLVFAAYFFERRASHPVLTQVLFGVGLLLAVPPTIAFLLLVFFFGAIAGMF